MISTALSAIVNGTVTNDNLSRRTETLRLFIDCIDFRDRRGDGWDSLFLIYHHHHLSINDEGAAKALLLWILKEVSYDLNASLQEENHHWSLDRMCRIKDVAPTYLSLCPEGTIDAVNKPCGYTVLMSRIALAEDLNSMISLQPSICPVGYDRYYSPQWESPTSLAMYSAVAFLHWKDFLESTQADLDALVNHETTQGPLARLGWRPKALRKLFSMMIEPNLQFLDRGRCCNCDQLLMHITKVQPHWLFLLDKLKFATDPFEEWHGSVDPHEHLNMKSGHRHNLYGPTSDGIVPQRKQNHTLTTPNLALDEEWDINTSELLSGYRSQASAVNSDPMYDPSDALCVDCGLHYLRFGEPRMPDTAGICSSADVSNSDADSLSDHDYSPFLFHI